MIIQNHSALERASFKATAASVGKRTLFVYRDKRIIFEVKA